MSETQLKIFLQVKCSRAVMHFSKAINSILKFCQDIFYVYFLHKMNV